MDIRVGLLAVIKKGDVPRELEADLASSAGEPGADVRSLSLSLYLILFH